MDAHDRAYYFPYKLDIELLEKASAVLLEYSDFTSFSKRNTQVKTFICNVESSSWAYDNECLVYKVVSNRFLRGMVRGLVSTMLKTARNIISIDQFREIIELQDCTKAGFEAPPHGLFLMKVNYKEAFEMK